MNKVSHIHIIERGARFLTVMPQEDLAPKYQRDFFLTVIDPSGTPLNGLGRHGPSSGKEKRQRETKRQQET